MLKPLQVSSMEATRYIPPPIPSRLFLTSISTDKKLTRLNTQLRAQDSLWLPPFRQILAAPHLLLFMSNMKTFLYTLGLLFVLLAAPNVKAAAFPVSVGGTGGTSFTAGNCILGNGTSAFTSSPCSAAAGKSPFSVPRQFYFTAS